MLVEKPIVLSLLMLLALPAAAAEVGDFPAERLRPATEKEGLVDVEAASVGEHFDFDVGVLAGYEHNPLVLVNDKGETVGKLVEHRVHSSLVGGLSLFEWVRIGIEVPLTLYQTRDTAALATAIAGTRDLWFIGLGDVRLSPKIRVLRQADQFVDLAVIPGISVPTGFPQGNYLGEQQFTFQPEAAVGRSVGPVKLLANVGARLRFFERQFVDLKVGHELFFRAGAGLRLHDLVQLPLEVDLSFNGATYLLKPFSAFNQSPLEGLLAVRYDVTDAIQLGAWAGLGIVPGFGTPDARAGLSFWFAPRTTDRDGDGILDKVDACVAEPEDKDGFEDENGCPDPDNDADGVLDVQDGAPMDPEDADGFEDVDGVPDPDNDKDGIADADDKCINVAGVAAYQGCPTPDADKDGIADADDACPNVPGTAALKGCPDQDGDGVTDANDRCPDKAGPVAAKGCPDTDKDGISDPDDKCPTEAEVINNVDDEDGCPDKGKSLVVVTGTKIEILDKVYFDVGKATLQGRSTPLLDQVAAVLKNNPQITKVQVEGHTDSDGSDDKNLKLSQARTESVVAFLVGKGIAANRLTAVGYGETKPVAPNNNKANKEQNRRVEFSIVQLDGKAVEATQSVTSPK